MKNEIRDVEKQTLDMPSLLEHQLALLTAWYACMSPLVGRTMYFGNMEALSKQQRASIFHTLSLEKALSQPMVYWEQIILKHS